MRRALLAYVNHAALNAGAALACIWYCIVPPQWTGHSSETIDSLAADVPWRAFWKGIRD